MPNLLKDLVAMVAPQAKRPLQSPSTTNRLPKRPIADLAARTENAEAGVTAEQRQEQARMDAFVFVNMLR
ncbi:hypothetical protein PHMEG_000390 [Phytophthora megakarya]|uniref:Uncharacterized protein n=1 Tax=Phytophthora megakarya TaxID=4795 RepID=A0A225X3S4_9STRA|nr:hypothetical protein PHMEG_000390 [Phytophthora megakarya]